MVMDAREIRRRFRGELGEHMIRAIEQQGWRVEATRNGAMIYPADRSQSAIAVHGTPSDHRALANTLSRMRRSGYLG